MTGFSELLNFSIEHCCNCHVPFAITTELRKKRLEDRKDFYCPNGHGQHYTGQTEAQKLKAQLEREQQAHAESKRREAQIRTQRDQVAKMHNRMRERVKNGVCPCCNRTFQNLLSHMKTQHPEFSVHGSLRVMRSIYGMTQANLADEAGVNTVHVSQYETGKGVAAWAKRKIDAWIENNKTREIPEAA